MRINGQSQVSGVKGRGSKKRTDSSGSDFTLDTGDGKTSENAASTSSSGIQGMDALLALQSVEEQPDERRSKATQRGHDLLDTLDELKADLLAGRVSEERLERLASRLSEEIDSGDERVEAVLREIELRAKVELAKLGRF